MIRVGETYHSTTVLATFGRATALQRKLQNIPSIPEKHFHCCRSSFISVLIEFTLTHPRCLAWAFQTFLKGKQHAFKQNNNNNKGREVNNGFELKYKVSVVFSFSPPHQKENRCRV